MSIKQLTDEEIIAELKEDDDKKKGKDKEAVEFSEVTLNHPGKFNIINKVIKFSLNLWHSQMKIGHRKKTINTLII